MQIPESGTVLLLGTGGVTGVWYARLLLSLGYRVIGSDDNASVVLPDEVLHHPSFSFISPPELLPEVTMLTLSPGVPLSSRIVTSAEARGIPVFSELEFSFRELERRKFKGKVIGITGTDGKSTVTSLIHALLSGAGEKSTMAGNIGTPLSQLLYEDQLDFDSIVLELSSYQLERSRNLHLFAALYLNLAPDHLNRYSSMREYALAKWNIAANVEKATIVNARLIASDSPYAPEAKIAQISSINAETNRSENFFVDEQKQAVVFLHDHKEIIRLDQLNLLGKHNHTNVLFALETILQVFGKEDFKNKLEKIVRALKEFSPLPHRYEKIPAKDGNLYINDSKATTTQAALTAIAQSPDPLYVFLGGQSKGEDYSLIVSKIAERGATAFLYGQNAVEIKDYFQKINYKKNSVHKDLEEAFQEAQLSQRKEQRQAVTYLLAPASTSWDQYKSFEARGNHFRSLVENL